MKTCALLLSAAVLAVGAAASNASVAPHKLLSANRGWVVAHPHLYNIFWDDDWAKHNPWARHDIDVATKQIVDDGYFAKLAQYGVSTPAWEGSHSSAAVLPCRAFGPARAPVTISSAQLFAWVSCAVSVLHAQSRLPVSEDVYVVYLPTRTTITDGPSVGSFSFAGLHFPGISIPLAGSCSAYNGYHFFGLSLSGPFAYAVVPAACAHGSLQHLTGVTSHELVEMLTDPVITQGWIDDAFSGVNLLEKAEAADLCNPTTSTQPTAPPPPKLIPSGTIAGASVELDPYWSNGDGRCVAP